MICQSVKVILPNTFMIAKDNESNATKFWNITKSHSAILAMYTMC